MESAVRSVVAQASSQNAEASKKILALYQKDIEEASAESAEPIEHHSITTVQTETPTEQQKSTFSVQSTKPTTEVNKEKASAITQVGVDIFQPLIEKYDKREVWMARRIFKSLSDNCPSGSISLIEDLKKLVIKDLS